MMMMMMMILMMFKHGTICSLDLLCIFLWPCTCGCLRVDSCIHLPLNIATWDEKSNLLLGQIVMLEGTFCQFYFHPRCNCFSTCQRKQMCVCLCVCLSMTLCVWVQVSSRSLSRRVKEKVLAAWTSVKRRVRRGKNNFHLRNTYTKCMLSLYIFFFTRKNSPRHMSKYMCVWVSVCTIQLVWCSLYKQVNRSHTTSSLIDKWWRNLRYFSFYFHPISLLPFREWKSGRGISFFSLFSELNCPASDTLQPGVLRVKRMIKHTNTYVFTHSLDIVPVKKLWCIFTFVI